MKVSSAANVYRQFIGFHRGSIRSIIRLVPELCRGLGVSRKHMLQYPEIGTRIDRRVLDHRVLADRG